MIWIRYLLLRLGIFSSPHRQHRELLTDLSGGDKTAAGQFEKMLLDRKRAIATLEDEGWGAIRDGLLADTVLLHVAVQNGLVTKTDRSASTDEIFDSFGPIIRRLGLERVPHGYYVFGKDLEEDADRGSYAALVFPLLEKWAEENGQGILNLNNGTDLYHFALISPDRLDDWKGAKLSKVLRVESSDIQ